MRGKQRSCLFQPFIPAARRHSGQTTRKSVFAQIFFLSLPSTLGSPCGAACSHRVQQLHLCGKFVSPKYSKIRSLVKYLVLRQYFWFLSIPFSGKHGTVCRSPPAPLVRLMAPPFQQTHLGDLSLPSPYSSTGKAPWTPGVEIVALVKARPKLMSTQIFIHLKKEKKTCSRSRAPQSPRPVLHHLTCPTHQKYKSPIELCFLPILNWSVKLLENRLNSVARSYMK